MRPCMLLVRVGLARRRDEMWHHVSGLGQSGCFVADASLLSFDCDIELGFVAEYVSIHLSVSDILTHADAGIIARSSC